MNLPVGAVRSVTAEEIDALNARGWTRLDRFVDPGACRALLIRARELLGPENPDPPVSFSGTPTLLYPAGEDPLFEAFACGPSMGEAAAQLLGWNGAVRLWADALVPVAGHTELPDDGNRWHQDARKLPLDTVAVGFWIALERIDPEQGQLRFRDGSHRLGPLGALGPGGIADGWPGLSACPVTLPGPMEPGDATAHLSLVALAAEANRTDRTLWPYSLKYFPDGACYTGLPAARASALGLVASEKVDHPAFPVVWSGPLSREAARE